MSSAEKFCLRWNDFETNISTAFRELREDKDFFDVTLACDDDQIEAHKVILSACSPFFRSVLKRNRHDHPLLYLKGIKFVDLVAVLNFMYHGEVNIAQEDLNTFLTIAEELKVKGLTQNGGEERTASSKSSPRETLATKPTKSSPPKGFLSSFNSPSPLNPEVTMKDDGTDEVSMVKAEPDSIAASGGEADNSVSDVDYPENYDNFDGFDDGDEVGFDGSMLASGIDGNKGMLEYEEMLKSMIDRIDLDGVAAIRCKICFRNFKSSQMTNLKNHLEAKHIDHVQFACRLCSKLYSSRTSLQRHVRSFHKLNPHDPAGFGVICNQ